MDPHAPSIASSSPRRRPWLWLVATNLSLGWLSIGAGCSQPGPFMQRQTMMGALKSNVAQLESEKSGLSKELADLKAENRRIENERAAVEEKNGELAARLDDARNLISRQGIGDGDTTVSRSSSDVDRPSQRRATPARSQPRGRKPPIAQIPSERRSVEDPDLLDSAESVDLPPPRARRQPSDDQSRVDDRSPWVPIAKGRDRSSPRY